MKLEVPFSRKQKEAMGVNGDRSEGSTVQERGGWKEKVQPY